MKPVFSVKVGERDIKSALKGAVVELSISDQAGVEADSFSLVIQSDQVAKPTRGVVLTIEMGYQGERLIKMGSFNVDEITLNYEPRKLTIKGRAANFKQALKSARNRHYENATLGGIAADVATRHGLVLRMNAALKAIQLGAVHQDYESDLALLNRLTLERNAVVKVVNDQLIVASKNEAKSVTGVSLPVITLKRKDVQQLSSMEQDRGLFNSVGCKFYDMQQATNQIVIVGEGEPLLCLKSAAENQQKATDRAVAQFRKMQESTRQLSFSCLGNPLIKAESPIVLQGYEGDLDGEYVVSKVTHQFNAQGFRSSIMAKPKKMSQALKTRASAQVAENTMI